MVGAHTWTLDDHERNALPRASNNTNIREIPARKHEQDELCRAILRQRMVRIYDSVFLPSASRVDLVNLRIG